MRGQFLQTGTDNDNKVVAQHIAHLRTLLEPGSTVYAKLVYKDLKSEISDDNYGVRGWALFVPYLSTEREPGKDDKVVAKIAHITFETCYVTGWRWYSGKNEGTFLLKDDATYLVTNRGIQEPIKRNLSLALFGDTGLLNVEIWK